MKLNQRPRFGASELLVNVRYGVKLRIAEPKGASLVHYHARYTSKTSWCRRLQARLVRETHTRSTLLLGLLSREIRAEDNRYDERCSMPR
jgi:hypothetical protein